MSNFRDKQVEYNYLGNSGLRVSNICLGSSTFGDQKHENGRPGSDDVTTMALLDRFAELGGNFINNSDMYSFGQAERLVGKWLSTQPREKFVISSKVSYPTDKADPNSCGTSRKHLMEGLRSSLRNLQTDHLDIYILHFWDPKTPLEETLLTLNDMVRSGQVRYLGASNFTGWQLQKTADYCKFMGLNKFISLESEYSLLSRTIEMEVTDVCRNEGIGLTPWSPLKGGWLTGKIKKGMTSAPTESRIGWATSSNHKSATCPTWDSHDNQPFWDFLDVLQTVANQTGKSMAQVSLRWLLQKDVVSSVIIGARTLAQLDDNMGAAKGWMLSDEQMAALDEASMEPVPAMYSFAKRMNQFRL